MRKIVIMLFVLTAGYLLLANNSYAQTSCSNPIPVAANLFQIDPTSNSAKLSFTPPSSTVTGYNVYYGFTSGDQKYTTSFPYGTSSTVVTYTVGSLNPQTTYFFSVQAINGCAQGPLSNWLSTTTLASTGVNATPSGQITVTPITKLPQTGSANTFFPLFIGISALIILASLVIT